jgi:hypothetical protein
MPVKKLTPDSAIDDFIANLSEKKKEVVVRNLCYVGEKCVNHVKMLPSPKFPVMKRHLIPPHQPYFIDWSSNLRDSVGYVVVVDGNIAEMSGFSGEGGKEGEEFIKQLAGKYPEGVCLIVVAGMNYASAVSAKGYNVLDGSELLAGRLVPQMLKDLGFKRK